MLANIDGDVLVYLACKSRYKDGETIHPWHTNKPTFTMAEDALYLEDCWTNFKKIVEDVKDVTFANDHVMAMKSPFNYRDELYPIIEMDEGVFVGYKSSRMKKPEDSNLFVHELRKRAVECGLAVEATGREADDLVRMWAIQATQAGEDVTTISIDKDLDAIPGKHYNPKTKVHYTISEEYALKFEYAQLLAGDPVDDIPGIRGIGIKTALELLKDCTTEDEYQFVVLTEYQDMFGEKWKEYLLANGKLLHIQKHEHDFFTLRGWIEI